MLTKSLFHLMLEIVHMTIVLSMILNLIMMNSLVCAPPSAHENLC